MDDKFTRKQTQDNFITERVDIYKNNLLGEYDDSGNYSIAPQIIQELIELTKVRKHSYDNSIFCFGNLLGYGEIAFEVSFEKNRDSENRAKSSLYVLEDVDKVNGYLQNIIKTKLADFVSNVDDFIEESYAKFHVINEGEEDVGREKKTLDDLELEDSYILAKRAYMLLLDKLSSERMLDAYGKYFTARLTNLTKMDNEFSNAVLDMFNEKYELIEDIFLKEKNYKALNELLDSCIEGVSGTKDIYISQENAFNQMMSEHLNEFTENVSKLSDKVEQKAFGMLDPDDRNKMNQMNATFENSIGNNEVTFEEIDDNANSIENEIDESFQNPVIDAVEEEKFEPEIVSETTGDMDNSEESEENSIEQEETQNIQENGENAQENTEIMEDAQDNIINHILSMQEENKENEDIEENIEDDISEEYVNSNADFQKSRQNDRLNNITDRLSKLSEVSETIEQENAQESQEIEEIESNQNNETITQNTQDSSSLNKDRFSALFNYLEKKQDEDELDRDDFSM